jgi:hypothetical protein
MDVKEARLYVTWAVVALDIGAFLGWFTTDFLNI